MGRGALALLAALGLLAIAETPARAQTQDGYSVARFEPAERGSAFFAVDGVDFSAARPLALGATFDYAHAPLVVRNAAGRERFVPVRHQLRAHLGASFVVGRRVRLGLDVPFALHQDGDDGAFGATRYPAADKPALGDVRLAVDGRVVGDESTPVAVAVGVRGWVPTGPPAQFAGDGAARVAPHVLVGAQHGILAAAASVAWLHRFHRESYAGTRVASELQASLGAGVRLARRRVLVGPELWSRTSAAPPFGDRQTALDAILGAHVEALTGVTIGAAVGTGIGRAHGVPDLRALLSVDVGPSRVLPPPPPDRDGDAVADGVDACPDVPGRPSPDPDENGCPRPEPVRFEDADRARTSPVPAPAPEAVLTDTEIEVKEEIRFATDSADLLAESDATIAAVAGVLAAHPEITKLRVEGHTDATGDATYNDELSRRRAEAVQARLVAAGVLGERLVSVGYGSSRPAVPRGAGAAFAQNRRVVFTVLERR